MVDIRNYVNPHPRYSQRIQTDALAGLGALYVEDRSGKVFDRLLRSLRRGAIVRVCRPFLLAPVRGRPKTRRAKWVERHEAIKARGCKLECLQPNDCRGARMAMVAYEEIASSGRGAAGREKSGRPPKAYTPEQRVVMEREWHSKKHKTRAAAYKAIKAFGIEVTRGYLYAHYSVKS